MPITDQDIARHQARKEQIAAAQATPLPGPLLDGIAPAPKTILGHLLRPVEMEDIIFLQRIDSPLVSMGEISAKAQANGNGDLQSEIVGRLMKPKAGETEGQAQARIFQGVIESFFIFTRPAKEIRKLLRKGREDFTDEVMDTLKLNPGDLPELMQGLAEHFASAFSTAIAYDLEKSEDGSFQSPQALKATA